MKVKANPVPLCALAGGVEAGHGARVRDIVVLRRGDEVFGVDRLIARHSTNRALEAPARNRHNAPAAP